jgi:hypothetical protein
MSDHLFNDMDSPSQEPTQHRRRRRGWARRSTRRLLRTEIDDAASVAVDATNADELELGQRLLGVIRDSAETLDVTPGELIEDIVRRALDGRSLDPSRA